MQYPSDGEDRKLDTSLTDEKLEELKDIVLHDLSLDRQKLVWKFPFTGAIAMKLDIVPVRDLRVRTACTDGKKIYYDIDFYSKLGEQDRTFVLAHEIWHVVMMHMLRRQTRDMCIFNIATDKEINYILSSNGLSCPSFCLFPEGDEVGKSAEEIYELLLKNKKNDKGGNGGAGECFGGSGGGNRHAPSTDELNGQFDKHVYAGDEQSCGSEGGSSDGNGGSSGGIKDRWGEVGFDSDFNPTVDGDTADKIREAIVESAQTVRRSGRGTIPSSISSYIDEICKPEIDWRETLSQFVTSCYGGSRQWLPVNRRHVHSGLYLQSRRDERISVTVAIDTSGSCQSELPKFLGELISLLKSFGNYELNLLQCDADVASYEKYDQAAPFDFDYTKFKFCGGGGTDFTPVFDYVRSHSIDTDCLVYFTDGYGTVMKDPPPYPTLWIITKDGSMDFCDWGTKVMFKHGV